MFEGYSLHYSNFMLTVFHHLSHGKVPVFGVVFS